MRCRVIFISVSSQFIGYYMYILLLLQAGQVWKSNERLWRTEEGEDGDGWISLSGVGDKQGGNGAGGTGICPVSPERLWWSHPARSLIRFIFQK